MKRTPPVTDALYNRVVTAVVGTLLRYLPDKSPDDQKLLAQFNRVESVLFNENESVSFYLGLARQTAIKEIAMSLPLTDTHPKPRTKHLFRMDTDNYDPYDPTRNTEL